MATNTFKFTLYCCCCCLLALFAITHANGDPIPIRIGTSLALKATGNLLLNAQSVYNGIKYFQNWYDSMPNFVLSDGKEYRMELVIHEYYGNTSLLIEQYTQMATDPTINFLLGASGDADCVIRSICDPHKLLLHFLGAMPECVKDSVRGFSQLTPSSQFFSSAFLSLKLVKAHTYSYVTDNEAVFISACSGTLAFAKQYGMTLQCNITVPVPGYLPLTKESTIEWQNAMAKLAACKSDVVLVCVPPPASFTLIDYAKEIGYTPKQFIMFPMDNYEEYENRQFLSGVIEWTRLAAFPPDPFFGTPQNYSDSFTELIGYPPQSYEIFGTNAPMIYYDCIQRANTTDPDTMLFAMSRIDLSNFYGRVRFEGNHLNQMECDIIQFIPDNVTVIAPPQAQIDDMFYPIPTWAERESNLGWFVYAGDNVIAALFAVCTTLTLGLCACIYGFRAKHIFRAAQIQPSILMALGAIICYLSVFTWLTYVTDAGCAALPWILGTGFTILYGTMLLKTARVGVIFGGSQGFKQITFPEWHLYAFLGVLLTVLYAILIPWTAVSPLRAKLVQPQLYRVAYDYMVCAADSQSVGFLIAALVYCGILLFVGAFFAFRIRNIPYSVFNESKVIGFAIYNLLICCAVCVGLVAGDIGGNVSVFWIHSIIILFAPFATLAIIFCPKLYVIYKKSDTDMYSRTNSIGSTSNTNTEQAKSARPTTSNDDTTMK
jgi:hypothetical protein